MLTNRISGLAGGLCAAALIAFASPAAQAAAVSPNIVAAVPSAASLTDLGHAPLTSPISIAVTLQYRNAAALESLVEMQSDPSSPLFGHYLSNGQFNASFAPTPADYARVMGTLERAGFRVTQTSENNTVIDAVGTVVAANRLFSTDIHLVNQPGFGIRYANAAPAVEPAALRGLVLGVSGLQTLRVNRTDIATLRPGSAPAITPDLAGNPLYGPVSNQTGGAGYGPLGFSQAYLLPEQFKNTKGQYYTGTGRVAGVVIDADFLDSDLSAFLKYFQVTRSGPATVRVKVDGGPPAGLTNDSIETTLDVETIVSNAPGAGLYVYEFPSFNSNQFITDAYNRVVADNKVDAVNSSFGGCEQAQVSDSKAWDAIALQGASKGITFHASSGDSGADVCGTGSNNVASPASGPHFAAIGGTSLKVTKTGSWVGETVWNSDGGASTGGVSAVFPLPAWQHGIAGVIAKGRNVPDISFDADPNTGAAVYIQGTWNNQYNPLGGTSLSSPIFGAAVVEIDELLGTRSGLIAKTLYGTFAKDGYGTKSDPLFHDITVGCNYTTSPGYCAKKGYDQTTGIGSLIVSNFFK